MSQHLSPSEFDHIVGIITQKRNSGEILTLFELYIEACQLYNESLINDGKKSVAQYVESAYYEGVKNTYAKIIDGGMDKNILIKD